MRRALVLGAVAASALLLVGGAIHACRTPLPDAGPGMSDSTATVVKHLDATDTTYRRRQRAADSTAGVRRAERLAAEREARAQQVAAEREAALAAQALTARDSAVHWRLAYLGQRARADSLDRALAHETAGGAAILRGEAEVKDRVREQEAAIAGLRRDLRERTAQLAVAKENTKRDLLAGIALGVVADRLVPAMIRSAVRGP